MVYREESVVYREENVVSLTTLDILNAIRLPRLGEASRDILLACPFWFMCLQEKMCAISDDISDDFEHFGCCYEERHAETFS